MTKVTFIWHDCFFVETDKADIVFDFWNDPMADDGEAPLFIRNRDARKPLFVFVSHHHKDHYTREIFSWTKEASDIHFILSHDTARFTRHLLSPTAVYSGPRPQAEQVTVLKPGEKRDLGIISVEAFGSTDIGNSYFVEIGSQRIFHAGDLNAWIWKDESTEQEVDEAISAFSGIIDSIKERHPELDYAFFPVDSRIGRDFFTGAAIFVHKIRVGRFFPMHFCLGETRKITERYMMDACDFQNYSNREHGEYIGLTSPYSAYMAASEKNPGE